MRPIGGVSRTVEIGENLIEKRRQERGRICCQTWLLCAIDSRRCIVVLLMELFSVKLDFSAFISIIQEHILAGSLVISDSCKTFSFIKKEKKT